MGVVTNGRVVVGVGCEYAERVRAMLVWETGGVLAVRPGHEYMGGTCGSGNMSRHNHQVGYGLAHPTC